MRLGAEAWRGRPLDFDALARKASELRELAGRKVGRRSFEDVGVDLDPTGILKLPSEQPSVTTAIAAPASNADLDAAVADGRIEASERAEWLRRFEEDEPFAREVLNALSPGPERGNRAFEEDARIRSLGDQLDSYMGVPEADRAREYDDGLSDSERAYRQLAAMTPAGGASSCPSMAMGVRRRRSPPRAKRAEPERR